MQLLSEQETLLDLVLSENSVVQRNLLPSIHGEANAILLYWRRCSTEPPNLSVKVELLQSEELQEITAFAEQARVEIDITGDSIDLRTHAYQGSGRISNVNNADDAYVRALILEVVMSQFLVSHLYKYNSSNHHLLRSGLSNT